MSHLKCTEHERRVVVVNGQAIHRSTTGSESSARCSTKSVLSGSAFYLTSAKHFTSSGMKI
jgi:hypothetical protein